MTGCLTQEDPIGLAGGLNLYGFANEPLEEGVMSRIPVIALLFAAQLHCAHGRVERATLEAVLSFNVSPSEATFRLPVGRRAAWLWNRPTTPTGALEYEWGIEVENGDVASFGFYLFKRRPRPASGTLDDLLQAGQINAWQADGSRRRILRDASLSIVSDDSAIVFTITDAETVRSVFGGRPERAILIVQTPEDGRTRTPIGITYANR